MGGNTGIPGQGRPPVAVSVWLLALACLASGAACRGDTKPVPPLEKLSIEDGLRLLVGTPMVRGNALDLIENGAVFEEMEKDIRAARVSVNIVVYIWRGEDGPSERVGQALLARKPGVACRIIIDPFGSLKFSNSLEKRLVASGCDIRRYGVDESPGAAILARNHRKIQIVDGKRAITGGFGIWKSWVGDGRKPEEWRDTAVRARGPVVAQMQEAFQQNWRDMDGDPLPAADFPKLAEEGPTRAAFVASSPRRRRPSEAEIMSHLVAANAKRSLTIANSYFIPDDKLQGLLAKKGQDGVEVRVLAPGPVHDVPPVRAAQRATYARLLQARVRIWEYQASMMHAKTMVVDDRYVVIGSTNFDQLSFDYLEEGSLVADAPFLARKLRGHIEKDLEQSQEITRALWDKRDVIPDIARNAVGLFSDWL